MCLYYTVIFLKKTPVKVLKRKHLLRFDVSSANTTFKFSWVHNQRIEKTERKEGKETKEGDYRRTAGFRVMG